MSILRRYKSPIYGNYRKAYLMYGSISGLIMGLYVLVQWLANNALNAPETYGNDFIMGICVILFGYKYRQKLPEQKVFFKEMMLLGLGIGVLASIVYGLFLMLYGQLDTDFCARCINARLASMNVEEGMDATLAIQTTKEYTLGDWAFIGFFRSAVMSIMIAFIAAIILKTEKNIRR